MVYHSKATSSAGAFCGSLLPHLSADHHLVSVQHGKTPFQHSRMDKLMMGCLSSPTDRRGQAGFKLSHLTSVCHHYCEFSPLCGMTQREGVNPMAGTWEGLLLFPLCFPRPGWCSRDRRESSAPHWEPGNHLAIFQRRNSTQKGRSPSGTMAGVGLETRAGPAHTPNP